jgi:hypothetical protein
MLNTKLKETQIRFLVRDDSFYTLKNKLILLSNIVILYTYTVHIVIKKFRKSSTSVSCQETVNNLIE